MAVAEAEDGLQPVPRESSELEKEGELDTVLAVHVLLLRHGQVSLYDHCEVFDVYDSFLAFLPREAVLL